MAISREANEWLQILYIFCDFVCNSCELCMSKIKESLLAISIFWVFEVFIEFIYKLTNPPCIIRPTKHLPSSFIYN